MTSLVSRGRVTERQRIGNEGEALAAAHLQSNGLRVIERNYRVKGGEIDLVCRDGASTVFVEVRRRAGNGFGGAAASVGSAKQRRLILAARHWLASHGEVPCRFDVVAIDGARLEWIRNAFLAE